MKFEESEKDKLKRYRRARKGRTLPRSGDGPHEEKYVKRLDRLRTEEFDQEVEDWKQGKYNWQDYEFGEIEHELDEIQALDEDSEENNDEAD